MDHAVCGNIEIKEKNIFLSRWQVIEDRARLYMIENRHTWQNSDPSQSCDSSFRKDVPRRWLA